MTGTKRRWPLYLGIGIGAALLVAVAGPFVYINFIAEDAPPPLALPATGSTTPGASTTSAPSTGSAATTPSTTGTTGTTGTTAATATTAAGGPLDGTWTVTSGSQAGYRVVEVLFGQDNTAVGRTTAVAGSMVVSGSTVRSATVEVDLTSVRSDDNRRDNQFSGRIMNVSSFPKATFTLTQPISASTLPADGVDTTVQATGQLTLRGTTRPVTASLTVRRTGNTVAAAGSINVVFADFGIPNPSVVGITTQDHGVIEFLVNFARS